MKYFQRVLSLILIGFLNPYACADIIATFVNSANGHTYHLLTESTWQEGQNEALTLGGNLVTINDAAEQAWVFSTFGSFGGVDRSLWIGLNDRAQEGTFTWISGESSSYSNWISGQPDNNPLGDEDYVHITRTNNGFGVTPGLWNDLSSPNGNGSRKKGQSGSQKVSFGSRKKGHLSPEIFDG